MKNKSSIDTTCNECGDTLPNHKEMCGSWEYIKSSIATKDCFDYYENPAEHHDVPCGVCGSYDWTDWLLLPHKLFNKVNGYICFDCFVKKYPTTPTALSSTNRPRGKSWDEVKAELLKDPELKAAYEAELALSSIDEILDDLYLDAWSKGRGAERNQSGIRSVTPNFKEAKEQIVALIQDAVIKELEALHSLPNNKFKFTLEQMHTAIHKRICQLKATLNTKDNIDE